MEKSIENIWKKGFLNNGPLAIPKINDLYTRKSINLIDKYKRRFRTNINVLFIVSFIVLLGSILIGMPLMGVPMFFMLNAMVIVDKKLLHKMDQLDKTATCYSYLKSLNNWMNLKTKRNIIVARFLYPITFISIILGQWFLNVDGSTVGDILTRRLLQVDPDMSLTWGFPTLGLIGVAILSGILVILAERLYKWDVSMGYGAILRKLDELMADMEELRN